MQQYLIVQNQRGFVEQPGRLNIMTIALDVALALPLVIEEEVEMISFLVQKLIGEDIEQIADALLQFRSLPYTIKIGIWLDDMQMGIHRTGTILILIRETHVCNRIPLTGQCLDISVILGIKGMLLYVMIQGDGDIQRLLVACCTGILRETIDSKADGVSLLLGIERIALIVNTPVDAAIFPVEEIIAHIILGTGGSLKILRLLQDTIGCRKRPEDTGIHHCSLLGYRMYLVVTVYTSVKAAVFFIFHFRKPIAEDVVLQNIPHRFFKIFHSL